MSSFHTLFFRVRQYANMRCILFMTMLGTVLLIMSMPTGVLAWLNSERGLPASHRTVMWPDVAVSQNGHVHMVWLYASDGNFYRGHVYYVRGSMNAQGTSITWDTRQRLFTRGGGGLNVSPAHIVTDNQGDVHIAFGGSDGIIYYMYNNNNGRAGHWRTEQVHRPGTSFFQTDIAVDDNGSPFVAWGNGLNPSRVVMAHRAGVNRWNAHDFSPVYYITRQVSIAVSGSGANARVFISYGYQTRENGSDEIGYSVGRRDQLGRHANISQVWG